jgi:hypothetical protein
MRSDQLTHPVALVLTGQRIYGISGEPFREGGSGGDNTEYNGFYLSQGDFVSVGFTLGYLNAPVFYVSPWEYETYKPSKHQDCIQLKAGETLEVPVRVYQYEADQAIEASGVIRELYQLYHQSPGQGALAHQAVEEIMYAITTDAYSPRDLTYGLISKKPVSGEVNTEGGGGERFAFYNDPEDEYSRNYEGLIAWTNGTVIAVPLLQASYITENKPAREQALDVINDIVIHSLNPRNGLPFCTKIKGEWSNEGWWAPWVRSEQVEPAHSSYIIGQSLYYILKAYDLELKKVGEEHTEWLNFVEKVLELVAPTQNKDGAFPRFWSEQASLKSSEYDAFSGSWVAAAMAYHASITGNDTFLQSARNAAYYYYRDVLRMDCIKTPLDVAEAADSEGVLAFIRLARVLHEITREDSYISMLKNGLDYELSFKYGYNVPITSSPLSETGWTSSGGSITSVCNAVVHCMSNTILDETYYFFKHTGDDYYKARLQDTYAWGLQAYNREANDYFFGKKGWSTEYFCQADRYVLDIRLEDGRRSSIWFAYHPWATASILEGMCGELWQNEIVGKYSLKHE